MKYTFVNENGKSIDNNALETIEQELVNKYIDKDDIVLELGARYGTVSVTINKILSNPRSHLAVEPDLRVIKALETNKRKNNCEFEIWAGFISKRTLDLHRTEYVCQGNELLKGYGSTFVEADNSHIPSKPLEHFCGYKFNTLVADCEGFLEEFFRENPTEFESLNKIIFEEDYPDKCDYVWIKDQLQKYGFNLKECVKDKTPNEKEINHLVYIKGSK